MLPNANIDFSLTMSSVYSRKSSFNEDFFAHKTKRNAYTNFNITVQLNTIITPTVLSASLRELILENPTLSLNFEDDPNTPKSFIARPAKRIYFDDVVQFNNIDHPIDEEQLKKFDTVFCPINLENAPLWRLQVNQYKDTQYLTVFCEHSLFDGNSGVYFHKDLIEILDRNIKSDTLTKVLFDSEKDRHIFKENPPLPSTQLVDLYDIQWLTRLKIFFEQKIIPEWLLSYWRSYFDPLYPDLKKNPIFRYKTVAKEAEANYRIVSFTKAEATTILANIKRQKATFTPVLTAIATQTFQDIVGPVINPNVKFSAHADVLINGRRFHPGLTLRLKYAFCVTGIDIILGPVTNLESSIQYITDSIQENMKTKKCFKKFGILKYEDPVAMVTRRIGQHSRCTIEVSNLGNHIVKTENVQLENIWFSQMLGGGAQIGFSVISGKGGINLTLGIAPEIFHLKTEKDQSVVQLYATELKRRLLSYENHA